MSICSDDETELPSARNLVQENFREAEAMASTSDLVQTTPSPRDNISITASALICSTEVEVSR